MITKEEIAKFIEEKGDSPTNFIIRTPDEEKTYLDNFKTAEVEKAIGPEISKLHSHYDDDIFAITGLRKRPDQKTYDFAKEILSDFKGRAEKVKEYEDEIKILREKIEKGTDPKALADLEKVRQDYAALKEQSEREIKELKSQFEMTEKKTILESAANAFEYDSSISKNVLAVYKDTVINELLSKSEKRDNVLIFLDDQGNPMRNTAKNLAPYTAEEIIAERLKDVIKQKRVLPGVPKPGEPPAKVTTVPDTVKTKIDLGNWLMKEGLKRGTDEYNKAYADLSKDLPNGY